MRDTQVATISCKIFGPHAKKQENKHKIPSFCPMSRLIIHKVITVKGRYKNVQLSRIIIGKGLEIFSGGPTILRLIEVLL